jgi:hypothetical protein
MRKRHFKADWLIITEQYVTQQDNETPTLDGLCKRIPEASKRTLTQYFNQQTEDAYWATTELGSRKILQHYPGAGGPELLRVMQLELPLIQFSKQPYKPGKNAKAEEMALKIQNNEIRYKDVAAVLDGVVSVNDVAEWCVHDMGPDHFRCAAYALYTHKISREDIAKRFGCPKTIVQRALDTQKEHMKPARVCAVRVRGTIYVEIGWTLDPIKHLEELQRGNPIELYLDQCCESIDPRANAISLRASLKHHHIRGDWFDADGAMVARQFSEHVRPPRIDLE